MRLGTTQWGNELRLSTWTRHCRRKINWLEFCHQKIRLRGLLCIMDEWTTILDSGAQVDAIYTDFAKAFDTVPHRRLLSILKLYNI